MAAPSAGDVSSVAVTLGPTTAAASSSTSVLQSVNLAVLSSTAVAIPSESSSSKLTPATSGGRPEPAGSLQLSVVSGSSPNLVQFAASSQSEVPPLRSAGFDVRSGSAPSLGGFQFNFAALNRSPVSSEMASVASGGLTYKSSMPTVASDANAGFNLLQSGLAKGEVSGVHSTSLPGINVNNDSNKFSFEITRKAPDVFISQSSSATTTGVDFGNAGSSAIAQTGFTLPNNFSQNSSVFPNSGISGSDAIPTTSNGSSTIYSISQATPVTNSKKTASVDFLNDINRSQASKNQDTPKTSSNSYPGALGFSLASSAPLSSSHVPSTTSSVNSTPVNSFMSRQISSDPFGGPTSTVANSFLQAANLFSSPISLPGIFGPTSTTATFGSQSLGSFTSFSSPSGVSFGNQTDQHNAFVSRAASGFSVQGNFALPNAMDVKASEQASQPPGSFGSFFNFLPTNTTDLKSFGSQLPSGGLNSSSSSSGLVVAFPPNQNLGSTNASNLFSFGEIFMFSLNLRMFMFCSVLMISGTCCHTLNRTVTLVCLKIEVNISNCHRK